MAVIICLLPADSGLEGRTTLPRPALVAGRGVKWPLLSLLVSPLSCHWSTWWLVRWPPAATTGCLVPDHTGSISYHQRKKYVLGSFFFAFLLQFCNLVLKRKFCLICGGKHINDYLYHFLIKDHFNFDFILFYSFASIPFVNQVHPINNIEKYQFRARYQLNLFPKVLIRHAIWTAC